MECLLPYLCMVTVPYIMVGLERMLDYKGVGLARFHCTTIAYLVTSHEWVVFCDGLHVCMSPVWSLGHFKGYRTLLETQGTLHHDSKYPLHSSSNNQCTSMWFYC